MRTLTKEQLEDFMVTVWEGGSNYWMDVSRNSIKAVRAHKDFDKSVSFTEKMAEYLWDGFAIEIVDAEDESEVLGELTLDKIHTAFNNPAVGDLAEKFIDEDFDVETTDCLIQWAIFNEIVYG